MAHRIDGAGRFTFVVAGGKEEAKQSVPFRALSMSTPPLSGIRVIELARILAGPWAGQLLADLGADVIKIENPKNGDDTRSWGPPFVEGKDGENLSAAYTIRPIAASARWRSISPSPKAPKR